MAVDYRQKAAEMVDPSFNERVQALKNALAGNLSSLDASKTGINTNYDRQIQAQNVQNTLGKNNYANTNLGRGLGRSTIVTSGLAGMDDANNTAVGNINTDRTTALNGVESQKSLANQNTNSQIDALTADRLSQIASMANQLQQYDLNMQLERDKMAQQAAEAEKARQFQETQAALDRAAQARSASSASTAAAQKAQLQQNTNSDCTIFKKEINDGTADQYLQQYGSDIINTLGHDVYNQMVDRLSKYKDTFANTRNIYQKTSRINNDAQSFKLGGSGQMLLD